MKKRVLRIFLMLLVLVLVVIQFIPINRENPVVDKSVDFINTESLPLASENILKNACYDCHSNETTYPWYSYVAPVSFVIEHHIEEGRDELNFSIFQTYSAKKKAHKLKEISEALREGWMPIDNYTWLHKKAKLTTEQREELAAQIDEIRAALK